jgi:hypothetical protein
MKFILLITTFFCFSSALAGGYPQFDSSEIQPDSEYLKHNYKMPGERNHSSHKKFHNTDTAKSHLGDHTHKKGGWMFTYHAMDMHMEDNLDGSKGISSDKIVTTEPNRFYGVAGQPSTLRVVPTEMDTRMDMFGLMYAQTDKISWMLMLRHIEKSMKLTTYMGGSGTTQRGTFKTKSSGIGDTSVNFLWKAFQYKHHMINLNLGMSLPTGDIDQKDIVLTPMGMQPKSVLPYGMQLGSGTYDLLPGFTYLSSNDYPLDWGIKYRGIVRIGENDEDYTLGDVHKFSVWGGYSFAPWIKTSMGLSYKYESDIDGIDSRVVLPVQTADPDNYGGDTLTANWGLTLVGHKGPLIGHKIKFDYTKQLEQNLNGIQMEMDDMISVSYQFSF